MVAGTGLPQENARPHKRLRLRKWLVLPAVKWCLLLLLCWFCLSISIQNQEIAIGYLKSALDFDTANGNESESGHDNDENGGNITEPPSVELKLRESNEKILSTVKTKIDLQFVDLTGNSTNNDHPHKGALDENGNPGYIHDEKALRHTKLNHSFPFEITQEQAQCDGNDATMQLLTNKVSVDLDAHDRAETRARNGGKPRAKLLCMIYIIDKYHDRLPAIYQTWGKKCDGFVAASNKTDPVLHTVNILHEGPEEYGNMWQKVRSMWSYVYHNYYDEYDWFHIGGDDSYVLVENLRLYLESGEIELAANGGGTGIGIHNDSKQPSEQRPLFLGCRWVKFFDKHDNSQIYNAGGPGYTLNKAALKALIMTFPKCRSHEKTLEEDVMVAQCLRKEWGVYPYDTKDDEGGERYMHKTPHFHLNHDPVKNPGHWYSKVSIDVKSGLDCCASKSVAFHEIRGGLLMKRMHAILYGKCNKTLDGVRERF